MPIPAADARTDAPLYTLADAAAIAAAATWTSASVACDGHDVATLTYRIDHGHDRKVQLSDDDATWYELGTGGLVGATPNANGAGPTPNRALVLPVGGARFLRLLITNNGPSPATLTARVGLR
jgi:hypothetical protein